MSDLKPTPARLRAMREALSDDGFPWKPDSDNYVTVRMFVVGAMMYWDGGALRYRATDAGREWLARHDKPAAKPQEGQE